MIKAVLFDLWGTLILDDPASGEARRLLRVESACAALAAAGFPYEAADVEAGFLAAGVEHQRLHEDDLDLSTHGRSVAYLRHVDTTLADRLDDAAWQGMHDAILTPALTHRPAIMPGARETLAAAKSLGLLRGLISNTGITPGFVLRELLDGFGLLEHLDCTVFSDEVEICKPAEAIFVRALEEIGVDAGDAVFVGDQPRLDVFGSRRAGMWCVQIGDLISDGVEPHARISQLDELLPALRALKLIG
ncbi:MAG: HAD family hydrolase [Chloroflexota bacterium]|nr:HAD family hydrolase [Chloroflexota bacterium]